MVQTAIKGWVWLAGLLGAAAGTAQTFDVNGQTSAPSHAPSKKHAAPSSNQNASPVAPQNHESGMGWGANIEVAREARAAQMALQHGDAASATDHAQRAVNAAPQNADLWFTLAYAARLTGKYTLSVDAYRRGLALKPSSVAGLSGLAQTYARMGRTA